MTIRIEKKGPVTTVILNRPERKNAVDRQTASELAAAFTEFDRDDKQRVGVFYGDHGTFCAGADLKAIAVGNPNRIEETGEAPLGPSRLLLSKPVIAAIAGQALAGGLELALWCDLRVAEEDSLFGFFERRWGVPLIDGGTVRLPRIVGLGCALDLILTGRPVTAREALEMGLINRVVSKGQSRIEAEKLASEIAEFPQTCLRVDRLSAYQQFDLSLDDALKNEFKGGVKALPEALEGATRFSKGAGRHGKFE